jgi:tRNA1(Val) A37 N6-methylase TrmN6
VSGHLLGGRVRHEQLRDGHRTGIEPVFLAASIPARAGERVLEGGTGSGAALLCLAARVAGLEGVGVERDPAMADIARANIAANGFFSLSVIAGDLAEIALPGAFDHAFANPPWHGAAGTASPDAGKEAAKRAFAGLFGLWAAALARPLRHRGTLTFVVAAAALPACLAAFADAGCGGFAVAPLWPRKGVAARLVLLRGIKGGRAPCRMLAGLVLHEADGGYTEAAQAVLRDGRALEL